ncbi:MAG: hypothetical protein WCJ49_03390, partial [Deltaproteobacteria bacterium]
MLFIKKIILFLIVAICGYAILGLCYQSATAYRSPYDNDPVSVLEMRSERAKPFLLSSSSVGYISELDYQSARTHEFQLKNVEHIGRYYATQYALSPLRVAYSTHLDVVVGHFLKDTDNSIKNLRANEQHLTVIRDLGDGVM